MSNRRVYSKRGSVVEIPESEARLVAEQLRKYAEILHALGLEEEYDEVNFSAYALEHAAQRRE